MTQRKASLVKASETVQGFVGYAQFCKDLVQMLGDAVLLMKPQIYSLIAQLVFESVSIQHVTPEGEEVIYLKRITDISSPFDNQITDNLPVDKILRLKTLDTIVKYFCMIERSP